MIDASDYHRAVELSLMRQAMAYRQEHYEQDWASCIALAEIMAVEGEQEHLQRIMDQCFKRIMAYNANTGDMPWITENDL